MQATTNNTFSSQQTPYISPVRSFFQNEFTKKIALIAAVIIGMLAIVFLQEYGLPIVAVLAVGVFLASNTCLDDTKVAPPATATSSTSTAFTASRLETPAYPEPQKTAVSSKNLDDKCTDTYDLKTCGKACVNRVIRVAELICALECCECCLAYAYVRINDCLQFFV